jgi:hypothetical protein
MTDDDRYEMLAARYLAALAKRDMAEYRRHILHQIVDDNDDDDTPPADDNETRTALRRLRHVVLAKHPRDRPRCPAPTQRSSESAVTAGGRTRHRTKHRLSSGLPPGRSVDRVYLLR